MSRDNLVDFSFLPVSEQQRLLMSTAASGNCPLPAWRAENRRLIDDFAQLLHGGESVPEASTHRVAERFGAAAYAERFQRICTALQTHEPPPATPAPRVVAGGVLKAFLRLENLRLLYDF